MSNIALYRKYRPAVFKEITGQDHIVTSLLGSIESGRISHAYLFAGSRGTGKTSIARIFARELGTTDKDMYEIDAASNRGIDDIRAIRDGVSVMPLESKYKVYIVDEVHMLTKEAFNALLKTLEEPPAHVIFILATTELDKLPATVVSRCQTFTFKKPTREILRNAITNVAKKEGYSLEQGSADLIAILGDGSFRDALGVLDKVLGAKQGSGKSVTLEHIQSVTGAPRTTLVNDFIAGIVQAGAGVSGGAGDARQHGITLALTTLANAEKSGLDFVVFTSLVLDKARAVLLLKSAGPSIAPTIAAGFSDEDFSFIRDLAGAPASVTSTMLVELLRAYDETNRAYIPSLPLELAIMRIAGGVK